MAVVCATRSIFDALILGAGASLIACSFDPSTVAQGQGADGRPAVTDADPSIPDADPTVPDSDPSQPDASVADADAMPPLSYQVVESFQVPVNGSAVASTTVLNSGEIYRLRVSGTFIISTGSNLDGDAEYYDFGNLPSSVKDTVPGVDNGIGIDDSIVDSNKTPKWGPFSANHSYMIDFSGKGQTISANLHDGNYSNNAGSLTLEILRLQ